MASRLGTLTLDLIAKTGNFVGPIDKATKSTSKSFKKLRDDANKLGKSFGVAVAGYVAAIGGLTAKGLIAVDSQAKLSRSLDTTFDSITALNMAFGDGGINDFESSLNRLNRRLGAAELGRGAALKTVEELNLNLTELSRLDAAERIAVIADRIKAVARNSQEAARFAQDLGFEQAAAAQLFLEGGDNIRQYAEDVEALGLSISDFDATQIEAANDALGIFGDITQAVQQQLAVQAAPFLQVIGTELENAIKEAGGFDNIAQTAFANAAKGAGFVADSVSAIARGFVIAANGAIILASRIQSAFNLEDITDIFSLSTFELAKNIRQDFFSDEDKTDIQQQADAVGDLAYEAILEQLEKPLPSAALDGWLEEAKGKTAEARAAFEATQSEENKFRNDSVRLTKDQIKAQDEYLKKLKETQEFVNGSQISGLDAQFEQYLNLAKSDIASGSQFLNDRINTLQEIIRDQKNAGFNVDSIAAREAIVDALKAGQLPSASGQDEDSITGLAKQGFDLAKLAYEETKRIAENTLRSADSLVAQLEQKQADPIGTIVLQIPGNAGQPAFEARLQGAESELQKLSNFVNNFTNDAARVAAGG